LIKYCPQETSLFLNEIRVLSTGSELREDSGSSEASALNKTDHDERAFSQGADERGEKAVAGDERYFFRLAGGIWQTGRNMSNFEMDLHKNVWARGGVSHIE